MGIIALRLYNKFDFILYVYSKQNVAIYIHQDVLQNITDVSFD